MKYFLLIVLGLIFLSRVKCQSLGYPYKLDQFKLNDKVNTMRTILYNASDVKGKPVRGSQYRQPKNTIVFKLEVDETELSFSRSGILMTKKVIYPTLTNTYTYSYDKSGQLISIDVSDKYTEDVYFSYENKKMTTASDKEMTKNKFVYEANDKGVYFKKTMYLGTKPYQLWALVFDTDGRVKKESVVMLPENLFADSYTYEYNEKGFVSKMVKYSSSTNVVWTRTFSYEYDEYGNWIKKWIKQDGATVFLEQRTFTYYK